MNDTREDEIFMGEALRLAEKAGREDEVPVGAVIVQGGRVIARAHNQVELLSDPTAHAEMIAVTQAVATIGKKWLAGCTLYVTLEPCSMCAGALVLARLNRVCFGAFDPKAGACGSVLNIAAHPVLNHRMVVSGGILAESCGQLLSEFFQRRRGGAANKGKKTPG